MSQQYFHFISGLPRSGSTLLAGILRQNPRFHAGMSSPVASLLNVFLEQVGANGEFATFFSHEKRRDMCRALLASYYADRLDKEVLFDTNRMFNAGSRQTVYSRCMVSLRYPLIVTFPST